MKTHRTLSLALLLCAAFAACGPLPTDSATAPDVASHDGVTIGSGNEQSRDGYGLGSGNGVGTGDAGTMDGGTMSSDSTGRGGFGIGSGN